MMSRILKAYPVLNNFDIETSRQPVFIGAICGGCLAMCTVFFKEMESCNCVNDLKVTGGLTFPGYSAKNLKLVNQIVIYADDDFETVRKYATGGVDNVPISLLSDDSLINILQNRGIDWHLKLIARELQYRHEHNLKIEE